MTKGGGENEAGGSAAKIHRTLPPASVYVDWCLPVEEDGADFATGGRRIGTRPSRVRRGKAGGHAVGAPGTTRATHD